MSQRNEELLALASEYRHDSDLAKALGHDEYTEKDEDTETPTEADKDKDADTDEAPAPFPAD